MRITFIDGAALEGFYSTYTRAVDNEPECASVTLETESGLVEIYEDKVKNIEILD